MKKIRDPVYGYIEVDEEYVPLIDCIHFQRLRNIQQTSYATLYPSAECSRFAHSLGVFHLSKIVYGVIISSCKKQNIGSIGDVKKDGDIFRLACLLHDIGHAPFSHIGEKYFPSKETLLSELKNRIFNGDKNAESKSTLQGDIKARPKHNVASHELMSAIIGIRLLRQYGDKNFESDDYEFFARCITGYEYCGTSENSPPPRDEEQIRNCFIQWLNSTYIDIDKIDYLNRDAIVSGYESMSIDYQRLLQGFAIERASQKYEIVFDKSSISVLENVVIARDSERKWIQTHPKILYMQEYIIPTIIELAVGHYRIISGDKNGELFSLEHIEYDPSRPIRESMLLADEDIFYLAKNSQKDTVIVECLDRSKWRKLIWKTEGEYTILLNERIKEELFKLLKHKNESRLKLSLDSSVIEDWKKELGKIIVPDGPTYTVELKNKSERKKVLETYIKLGETIQRFLSEKNIMFDCVFISSRCVSSGFSGLGFYTNTSVKIGNKICKMNKIPSLYDDISEKADAIIPNEVIYMYYNRLPLAGKNEVDIIDFTVTEFTEALNSAFF